MKTKICSVCHRPSVLWQSVPKMCKDCSMRLKSTSIAKPVTLTQTENGERAKPFKVYQTKAIKKVSTKQQLLNQAYFAQRKIYLKQHPKCEARITGKWMHDCTGLATDIHHKKGRGEYLLFEPSWMPVCRSCHQYIEINVEWAKEKGYSEDRLMKR